MIGLAQAVVLLVALQRLGELLLSRRNERRLKSQGAVELGAGHYPLIVALHLAWLVWIYVAVAPDAPVNWWLLGLYGLLQVARVWVIASLGPYWTARVFTLPERPLVNRGPYRFCRHPNYLVVCAEIAVLPLAFGAWQIALICSLINGALLAWRIRVEEAALAPRRQL